MIVATVQQTDRHCTLARQGARAVDAPKSSTDDQHMLQSFLVSLARGARVGSQVRHLLADAALASRTLRSNRLHNGRMILALKQLRTL